MWSRKPLTSRVASVRTTEAWIWRLAGNWKSKSFHFSSTEAWTLDYHSSNWINVDCRSHWATIWSQLKTLSFNWGTVSETLKESYFIISKKLQFPTWWPGCLGYKLGEGNQYRWFPTKKCAATSFWREQSVFLLWTTEDSIHLQNRSNYNCSPLLPSGIHSCAVKCEGLVLAATVRRQRRRNLLLRGRYWRRYWGRRHRRVTMLRNGDDYTCLASID